MSEEVRNLREQVKSIERQDASERSATSAAIGNTIDNAAERAEHAAQTVNSTYDMTAESIRTHPFVAVFGACVAGFILGRAIR